MSLDTGDRLAELAAQRRALNLALDLCCPDPLHWHARPGVPCSEPDAEYPWGWVCLPRIEREADTRREREALRRASEARKERTRRDEWREDIERRQRARSMARIAAAAHTKEQS